MRLSTHEEVLGRIGESLLVGQGPDGLVVTECDPAAERWNNPCPGRRALFLPACRLETLGDPSFLDDHRLRYAYVAGAMANGISSVELVAAMGRAGMLGIFGAAGLPPSRVAAALDTLQTTLGPSAPHGFNLIHSPGEPALESAVADLYIRRGVRLVEASAYLGLTLPVVRYRVKGLRRAPTGRIVAQNRIIAKVSRVEVASKFLSPPPPAMLRELLVSGDITAEQAELASRVPMADDITAEADSAGHTDNQPAIVLLPTMIALRDQIQARHRYDDPPRIGAAGGISTPWSAAAAFAMGAAYLVTGSVNQACVESGTSDAVREMLALARQADIAMAPAADMFEMGVKVQVLRRGTLFPMRAGRLGELYRSYDSLNDLPASERAALEDKIFRLPLEVVWDQTEAFFRERDPAQLDRAANDPKHHMALVFRWYLGQSSAWANSGDPSRVADYQVWCGPAMAAFNDWVRGSHLERPENRKAPEVALNILHGAAVLSRARTLAAQGMGPPPGGLRLAPLTPEALEACLTR